MVRGVRNKAYYRRIVCLAICLAAFIIGIAVCSTSTAFAAKDGGGAPTVKAMSALVYCENTGEVVYEKNPNLKRDPYTVASLMSALVVVQNMQLDKEIKITEHATTLGKPSMGLVKGERVTVEELLYGMLYLGAKDASYSLAVATAGSESKFIRKMNKMAHKNLGCSNTNFSGASGAAGAQTSTTSDYLKVLRVALSNDTIHKICQKDEYKMRHTNKSKKRVLLNQNRDAFQSVNAIRAGLVGFGSSMDYAVACEYYSNGLQLYILCFGATEGSYKDDLNSLLAYTRKSVKGVRVAKAGKAVGKVRIRNGAKTRIEAFTQDAVYAYLPKEGSKKLIDTQVVMADVKAPIQKGDVVGFYRIYAGDDIVNEVALVANEDVAKGWLPSYFGISNSLTMIILGVFLLIVLFFFFVFSRKVKKNRAKMRARERKIQRMAEEELLKELEHDQSYRNRHWDI